MGAARAKLIANCALLAGGAVGASSDKWYVRRDRTHVNGDRMDMLETKLDELHARVEKLEQRSRGLEAVDDETQARFDEVAEQRLDELRSQQDLIGRANAAFASAVGLDDSKIQPKLLRELEQVAERMSKDEPPPLARE